jgi:hypothetical protein
MRQMLAYEEREPLERSSQDVRPGTCRHAAIWVVEVASHRVIRADCVMCAVAGVPGDRATSSELDRPWPG